MEASVLAPPDPRASTGSTPLVIPWYIYAMLLGSTSIIAGVMWDISWHRSIGRDTFWTPAHLAIHAGGLTAGLVCGWLVLRTTFRGSPEDRAASVRFWGFRGPLGAWTAIWGALAMITSAPFDDWWHNAYGLDVEILSPPHVVLALGVVAIQVGALLLVLAGQNRGEATGESGGAPDTPITGSRRAPDPRLRRVQRRYRLLYIYSAGIMLLMVATVVLERTPRIYMHNAAFYRVAGLVFPVVLVAAARASRLRWPATATAAVYSVFTLIVVWVLPLFPAEPMLGPILQPVDHMVPPPFPLLLVAPAVAIDLVTKRFRAGNDWLVAVVIGVAFMALFVAVQWPFADFLMSPASRNWFFATHEHSFDLPSQSFSFRNEFRLVDADGAAFRQGLLVALLLSVLSARLGLAWGSWMERVQR